jgi:hypothetical protein
MLADALVGVVSTRPIGSDTLHRALVATVRDERRVVGADLPVRASGLAKMCPRAYALAAEHGRALGEVIPAASVHAMAVGEAVHAAFQARVLTLGGSLFQGWWERDVPMFALSDPGRHLDRAIERACGDRLEGSLPYRWIPRPVGEGWRYCELAFHEPLDGITGHCDGVLVWPDGRVELLEVKTISDQGYRRVDPWLGGHPLLDHLVQVQVYLALAGLDRARLVYLNKGLLDEAGFGAWVEWEVARDDAVVAQVRGQVRGMRAALRQVAAGQTGVGQALVRRADCARPGLVRAKRCPVRDLCFPRGWQRLEACAHACAEVSDGGMGECVGVGPVAAGDGTGDRDGGGGPAQRG